MKYLNDTKGSDPITGMMDTEHVEGFLGLTKREQFAAMAMQGLLANGDAAGLAHKEYISEIAVSHADALITALNK